MVTKRLADNKKYWEQFYKAKRPKEVQLSFASDYHQIVMFEINSPNKAHKPPILAPIE